MAVELNSEATTLQRIKSGKLIEGLAHMSPTYLEGIKRILQLENQVAALQRRVTELTEELGRRRQPLDSRIFAAGAAGDVVTLARGQRPRARSQALVVWRPRETP